MILGITFISQQLIEKSQSYFSQEYRDTLSEKPFFDESLFGRFEIS
jgi:hypothetical protein